MSIWEDREALDKLQELRDVKRGSERLTFDCFNLKYKEDRVHCARGRKLGTAKDGSLALITVLRGITSSVCKNCNDFVTDEESSE